MVEVFLEDPGRTHFAYDLMHASRLQSGTIYPILARLQACGWVVDEAEDIEPEVEGRPRRRRYRLCPTGVEQARIALAAMREQRRSSSWTIGLLRPQGDLR